VEEQVHIAGLHNISICFYAFIQSAHVYSTSDCFALCSLYVENRYISQGYIDISYTRHIYSPSGCFALCDLYVTQVHIAGLHNIFIYSTSLCIAQVHIVGLHNIFITRHIYVQPFWLFRIM
jgi:hypothetical protein